MGIPSSFLNCIVASLIVAMLSAVPAMAVNEARLDTLHAELLDADREEAIRLAREIERERANSGSPAMNLLLKRGEEALEAGDATDAVKHFTALTDHAPEFAEGWHRRAVAYAMLELYGPAVADLERALELTPRHYDAIATLGSILIEINKPGLAKEAFEQVLAIHPHHPEVTEALTQLDPLVGGVDL